MSRFTENVKPRNLLVVYMALGLIVGFAQSVYATSGAKMGLFMLLWILLLFSTLLLPTMEWSAEE